MTDYLYSISLAQQTWLFLASLGFGFFAGALYDLFRAVRLCFGSKKWIYRLTDISYLTVLGFLNFLFFLSANEGEIRMFAFFGEALGFTVYLCTVGFTFSRYFQKFVMLIKRILTAVFRVLTFPFRKIWKKLCEFIKKHKKTPEKSENKSKYPLKVKHKLLYNLTNRKQKRKVKAKGAKKNAD